MPARWDSVTWSDPEVREPLCIVWDYMRLVHPPQPSDIILVLGSFDPKAAAHAAKLWHAGLAPTVILSGGVAHKGGLLDTGWDQPEARVFADVAAGEGVPRAAMLLEERAQNTFENFTLGKAVAEQAGLRPRKILVVAKPYMTRRGFATGRKAWPDAELGMQCESTGVLDYFAREADPERTLQAMIGDLHRIMVYPALGFQIAQDVPTPVHQAFRALVRSGYGQRLVPGHDLN